MTDETAGSTHVVRIVDPDHVREVFVTGSCNVSRMGPYVNVLLTVLRPNPEALFGNRPHAPDMVVVGRYIFDPEAARGLADSILIQLGEARSSGGASPDFGRAN